MIIKNTTKKAMTVVAGDSRIDIEAGKTADVHPDVGALAIETKGISEVKSKKK